ncbi:SCO1860 family LAETG-anchored protein [Streptomyces sp. NBC_00878]|uniref:SCO1860 family LAETG-anchored protein n=1 Tax=Streptomyces sp. NBC_00878 TaxID=2975854 RepID=UPI002250260B|nr:SCO1860 family LAETG-anchored protein [Streptomyces sp. NBC_00878]MCX4909786.1 LPXTG cell wall anchor domain-containing protein [Streptomyces sp. NBC_00878]
MNSNAFRMPARRFAVTAAATVLAAGPAVLAGAGSAHATDDDGSARAVVLRTGLDVSLLNKSVNVPLTVSLNDVQAPRSAEETTLTAKLDGVDGGQPFTVLGAEVAKSSATVSARKAEGSVHLAQAKVHVPGLPLLSLIEVEQVSAKAVCVAGEKPVASANPLGAVTVLGRKTTVSAGGPTEVKVPGVGEVRLDLASTRTTTRTAAATALQLKVSINPLKLNVAEVEGTVTLAEATCETPAAPAASADPSNPVEPAVEVKPQGATTEESNLAETGGSSVTPYVAAGAVALLATGAGAVMLARRKRG